MCDLFFILAKIKIMEEQDTLMDEGVHQEPKKRPTFILVLAILSWIYVGIGLVSGLINSLTPKDTQMESLDNAIEVYQDMDEEIMPYKYDMIEFMEITKENYKLNSLLQVILFLIEGLGVFMMFNLHRRGFWIYTLSQVGFLSLILIFFPMGNVMTIFSFVFMLFIVLLFEILYAVNLKHMS